MRGFYYCFEKKLCAIDFYGAGIRGIRPGVNLTDMKWGFPQGREVLHYIFNHVFVNHNNHADAHIECPAHFFGRNISFLLQKLEDGRHFPAVEVDNGPAALR